MGKSKTIKQPKTRSKDAFDFCINYLPIHTVLDIGCGDGVRASLQPLGVMLVHPDARTGDHGDGHGL